MSTRITDRDPETGCTLRMDWDSVSEAVDGLNNASARNPANDHQLAVSEGWWYGEMCDNRSRAWLDRALESGDTDTLQKIDALRERIESASPTFSRETKRRTRRRGLECGDEMDADRFLVRDPMCWERMDRMPRQSRTIVIGCEVGVLGGVQRGQLLPRGAAVVALADWLIKAGYSVEIRAVWHSVGIYQRDESAAGLGQIIVKSSRAPLDISSIATACCEIAFARGVLLRSRIMHARRKVAGGLGRTTTLPESTIRALGIDISAPSSILSEAQAVAWLEGAVAKLSGNASEESAA